MPLLLTIISGFFALALVFIACELGQRMSDEFEGIDFTIDQFDWYLFPIEIKRMLPTIIAVAEQPVSLECFGSITCVREVFRKVCIKPSINQQSNKPSKFMVIFQCLIFFRSIIAHFHTLWCSVNSAIERSCSFTNSFISHFLTAKPQKFKKKLKFSRNSI